MSKNLMPLWANLSRELGLWADEGAVAQLWLRDDDAIEVTPALDRLDQLCQRHNTPYTIATIPNSTSPELASWCSGRALCNVAVHGVDHLNHASTGQKKCELGLHRGLETISDELTLARQKIQSLFENNYIDMLVPPWNRIDADLVPHLSAIGFKSLSTYGWPKHSEQTTLVHLNTHVDIIDWKGTRGGLPTDKLIADLIGTLQNARTNKRASPIGILTHHLVHDELAWQFLEDLMAFCHTNQNLQWATAKDFV